MEEERRLNTRYEERELPGTPSGGSISQQDSLLELGSDEETVVSTCESSSRVGDMCKQLRMTEIDVNKEPLPDRRLLSLLGFCIATVCLELEILSCMYNLDTCLC